MSRTSIQEKMKSEESFFKKTENNATNTPSKTTESNIKSIMQETALIRQTYYITEKMIGALGLMSVKTKKDKSEIVREMFAEYLKEYIKKLDMM